MIHVGYTIIHLGGYYNSGEGLSSVDVEIQVRGYHQ